jgi:hypothetical protein
VTPRPNSKVTQAAVEERIREDVNNMGDLMENEVSKMDNDGSKRCQGRCLVNAGITKPSVHFRSLTS